MRDYLDGERVPSVIGDLPRDLENELAARGVVDPKDGYSTTDELRHASRGGERKVPSASATSVDAVRQEKRELLNSLRDQRATKAEMERRATTRALLDGLKLESRRGRGFIEFSPPGGTKPRRFDINTLAKADKSTLAHETFHFLASVMGDLAQEKGAPDQLKADYLTLLGHMGVEGGRKPRARRAGDEVSYIAPGTIATVARGTIIGTKVDPTSKDTLFEIRLPSGQTEFASRHDITSPLPTEGKSAHEQRVADDAERRALDTKAKASEDGKGPELTAEEKARKKALHAKEERATYAWEQYLLEGKSPSVELVGVFARFHGWLARIYKSIQGVRDLFRRGYGEELPLSNDTREVFDRILASDEEIARMRGAVDVPLSPKLASAMTPEEQQEHLAAQDEARTQLAGIIARAQKAEYTPHMAKERERLAGEVERELDEIPAYRALRFLQHGDLPEAPGEVPALLKGEDGQAMKLDRAALVKKYGAPFVNTMPKSLFAPKGKGAPADLLAPHLGFETGDQLVLELQKTPPRAQRVAADVEQRLSDHYKGTLLDSPDALANEALSALHNPAAVRAALLARRVMARQLDPVRAGRGQDLDPEVLKRQAERLVAQHTVAELTSGRDGVAGKYLRAERTAAKRAQEAFEAGKIETALAENEWQLVAMHAWRSAREARETLDTQTALLQQATGEAWQKALGKADVAAGEDHAYRDAHNAILEAVGALPAPDGGVNPRALDALLGAVGEASMGFDVDGIRDLLARPPKGGWGELTQDQAQNVADAVKNIRHAASTQNAIEIEGQRIDKAGWMADLAERASHTRQLEPEAYTSSGATALEKAGHFLRSVDSALTEISSYVEALDNGDRNGPAHKLFIDTRREARATEVRLNKDVLSQVLKAFEQVPKALRGKLRETVPGLAELLPVADRYKDRIRAPETRSDLYMLFLNSGNEGNRQRLRDGNSWTDAQMDKALQLLRPEEARFLQGILDATESLRPELAKVHERRFGLPMGAVEATPIRIGDESFRGGYFPLRYDPRIARQGAVQESDVEAALYPQGYTSPVVYSGHTKERMQKVLAPVSLEWSTVPTHYTQVIHDIAFGDYVRQVGKVVLDDRFKGVVDKALGSERTKLFLPWARDIANGAASSVAAAAEGTPEFLNMVSAVARNGYARAVMGLNLPSMLAHLTDPLVLLAEAHGPKELAGMASHIVAAYPRVADFRTWGKNEDYKLSKELSYRDAREHENLRLELGKISGAVGTVDRVLNEVAFRLRAYVDAFHNRVIWTAAFHDSLARKLTRPDAARRADDLLSNALPSGDIAERAAILRTKTGFASVLMFYGYANKMYNLWLHRPVSRAVDDWSGPDATAKTRAGAVADLTAKWVTMAAIGAAGAYLAGKGPGDAEDKWRWLGTRSLLEPLNSMPFAGAAGEAIAAAVEGRPAKMDTRTVPELDMFANGVNRLTAMIRKAEQGGGGDDDVWTAIEALTKPVLGQAGKTLDYAHQVRTGQLPPQGVGGVAKGVIYGPPRRR